VDVLRVEEGHGILMRLHGHIVLQSQEAHQDVNGQSRSQNLETTKFECGPYVYKKSMDELYPLNPIHTDSHTNMNVYMYSIYAMWFLGLLVCIKFICINEPRRYRKLYNEENNLPINV